MPHQLLIVDDSRAMRAVIRKVLEMAGLAEAGYHEAGSGREALKVLAGTKIDLVLTDINMPEMTGLELLAEIKRTQRLKAIPVVIISTEGSAERKIEAVKLGASGYLQKPFQPEAVRKLLEKTLGWRHDG